VLAPALAPTRVIEHLRSSIMASTFEIRPAEPNDVAALHELSIAVTRDGRGVVFTVDDLIAGGPRAATRIAESAHPATRDGTAVLVATFNGAIVGEASVQRLKATFTQHVGVFSIEVHPQHQRRGIGRALLRACIEWAKDHGIERLELYTRRDNDRARALYESEGFTVESARVRFIRLPDGRYVDDVVYVRFLR
jgi:ribosomal protein S18 acetylase RimI-like enzyme